MENEILAQNQIPSPPPPRGVRTCLYLLPRDPASTAGPGAPRAVRPPAHGARSWLGSLTTAPGVIAHERTRTIVVYRAAGIPGGAAPTTEIQRAALWSIRRTQAAALLRGAARLTRFSAESIWILCGRWTTLREFRGACAATLG